MNETPMGPETSFRNLIAPLLEGLLYPSESDEPVHFLSLPWAVRGKFTAWDFVELFGLQAAEDLAELVLERFWSPVTTDQDWYGDEEKDRTARFIKIREILEENLDHIQCFEIGETEVELYLIGQSKGNIMGIKTTAIRV